MKKFNYLSLFSLFSLFALQVVINPDPNYRFLGMLAYLVYLSYLFVYPDELFIKNAFKSASYSFLLVVLLMASFMFSYYVFGSTLIDIELAFWSIFMIINISFNLFLAIFEIREGVYVKGE